MDDANCTDYDDGQDRQIAREELRRWGIVTGYLLDWARELPVDANVLDDVETKEAA